MFRELMTWSFRFLRNVNPQKRRIHGSMFRVFTSSIMLHLFHIYKFLFSSTKIKIFLYLFISSFNYSWTFVAWFISGMSLISLSKSFSDSLNSLYWSRYFLNMNERCGEFEWVILSFQKRLDIKNKRRLQIM